MNLLNAVVAVMALAVSQPEKPEDRNPNPPVKMSESGICHPKDGQYYSRTKKFTPYPSMEACVKAGGRPAKK